jgi:hypothetical protein
VSHLDETIQERPASHRARYDALDAYYAGQR